MPGSPVNRFLHICLGIAFLCQPLGLRAEDRVIGVFVALCDNEHQGIVPVPAAIGNGDDPESNLYWGTADGLKGTFDRSKTWKLIKHTDTPQGDDILRTRTYRHVTASAVLLARAYRGRSIKKCIRDFEAAVQLGTCDLAVYIGHDGLMDFDLPEPQNSDRRKKTPDCIVLCCKSERYFKARLRSAGGRPVLLTTQFMYPGSFILHALLDDWLAGGAPAKFREAAGLAYARNQKISAKSGLGVFADLSASPASRPSPAAAAGPRTASRPAHDAHERLRSARE